MRYLLIFFLIISYFTLPAQENSKVILYFDFATSDLTSESAEQCKEMLQKVSMLKPLEILVNGYTDIKGSAEYNLKLSIRRAEVVKKLLQDILPSNVTMNINGHGASNLVTTSPSEQHLNRRVEIIFKTGEKQETKLISLTASNDQKSFQKTLSVKFDTLQIDNTKDTLVFGSKGTGLYFEKESFELPDGTIPNGKISIQLKECYSNSDIVRENLSTTSNGRLLETRGMINVIAFSDNQELKLKNGKKFIIHFPKDSSDTKKQMNLFYANNNGNQAIDWKLDSVTLLKPTAYMSGWSTIGYVGGDTSENNGGFYFKGEKKDGIYDYFYKNFDNTKLQATKDDLQNKVYEAKFIVNKQGKITNIRITEEVYDTSGRRVPSKGKADPYFYEYMNQIPTLESFYEGSGNGDMRPFDAECSFYISMGLFPPDYRNNENYNKIFSQKYSAFKNNTIESMNDAELNYYIFSSAKLGWINCDFFWEVKDEKIDYIVKVDPQYKPNIKLVFKEAKSILTGSLEGDNYIFRNVPINQEIKIVAISFKDSKPLLSISLTKTNKQTFDKFDYKEFTLTDLEKQLNTP